MQTEKKGGVASAFAQNYGGLVRHWDPLWRTRLWKKGYPPSALQCYGETSPLV